MKEYPKILGVSEANDKPCVAFYKYDGSNLRFEWRFKRGWYKFGTRHRLFNETDPEYGESVSIFMAKYADGIEKILKDKFKKIESAIAYCEFFGPYSFAGIHEEAFLGVNSNAPKDLILFDVNVHKKGFIPPWQFLDFFNHLHIAKVVYEGHFTEDFVQDIRNSVYNVEEGVIVKGGQSVHEIWMRKIKTYAYLKKLKEKFKINWKNYWE